MEEEMASRNLPEELVEKIVAMMGFPSIFRARLLSKSWHARFRSVQSQNVHEDRTRAISFQKQVTESSSNRWGTFCYAYSPAADSLICFDQTLRTRQRLPSLLFLPRTLFLAFAWKYYARLNIGGEFLRPIKPYLQIEGPLLYGMLETNQELYVANILTQEHKKLPARLDINDVICGVKLVIETSTQTYKLILICKRNSTLAGPCIVHIYDSGANNWSIQVCTDLPGFNGVRPFSISAYYNGVLYMSISDYVEILLAYNLEKRRLMLIRFSNLTIQGNRPSNAIQSRLVVCDSSLKMIVIGMVSGYDDLQSESDEERSFEVEALPFYTVRVLEVDHITEPGPVREVRLEQLYNVRIREVNIEELGPVICLAVNRFTDVPVSQDNYKFFGMSKLPRLVLAYNECTKRWSCFYPKKAYRFSFISFQPGLHTFMAV